MQGDLAKRSRTMKPSLVAQPMSPDAAAAAKAPSGLTPVRIAVLTAAAVLVSAGMGFGLQQSLPVARWAGAAIAGTVALLLVPALLWVRPRRAPKLVVAAASAVSSLAPRAGQPAGPSTSQRVAWAGTTVPAAAFAPSGLPADAAGTASGIGAGVAAGDAQAGARDALTGAYTQQHFVAAADREWSRIRRHGEDAALLMVDIDHLAALNERLGLTCGDALLVEVTRQVSATLRQYDLLARFNGGVLVVYLPHTDPIGALDVAERIRERVAQTRLSWHNDLVKATVSVGVAAIGASHGALDEVIADAGKALREAKTAGRNCVRAAPIPPRRQAGSGQQIGAGRSNLAP